MGKTMRSVSFSYFCLQFYTDKGKKQSLSTFILRYVSDFHLIQTFFTDKRMAYLPCFWEMLVTLRVIDNAVRSG